MGHQHVPERLQPPIPDLQTGLFSLWHRINHPLSLDGYQTVSGWNETRAEIETVEYQGFAALGGRTEWG